VSGKQNPHYQQTYVFDNDHACVSWEAPAISEKETGIYRSGPARGVARVVCYSPKHNLTLAELEAPEIVTLLKVWQEQYRELGRHPEIKHVLIFENKGEVVGVSNPHPHCQIYATNFVFKFKMTAGASFARMTRLSLLSPILRGTLMKFMSHRKRRIRVWLIYQWMSCKILPQF
jgi:UDPglucose--hexose-1-phosphate uridylyltransferase